MVFKYFLKELIPQILICICVVAAIIIITQFFRISRIVSEFGFSLANILLPFLFILLPFISVIIPVAFLFAVVISFSRMNADGELTALFASGLSIKKTTIPVIFIGGFLYIFCVCFSFYVEPWASRELVMFYRDNAYTQLDNMIKTQIQPNMFVDNFLSLKFYTQDMSKDHSTLNNVMLSSSSKDGNNFIILAPSANISGSVEGQDLTMSFDFGSLYFFSEFPYEFINKSEVSDSDLVKYRDNSKTRMLNFKKLDLDLMKIFRDNLSQKELLFDDSEDLYPKELLSFIKQKKIEGKDNPRALKQYYSAKFLLHQRIALPFIIIIFGIIAVIISIQDNRRGKNTAYPGAILTLVIGYCTLMIAKGVSIKGIIPAYISLWVPLLFLLGIAVFLLYYKTILPVSSSLFCKEGYLLLKNDLLKKKKEKIKTR